MEKSEGQANQEKSKRQASDGEEQETDMQMTGEERETGE